MDETVMFVFILIPDFVKKADLCTTC